MKYLSLWKPTIAFLAVMAAGCGMPGGTSGSGPVGSLTPKTSASAPETAGGQMSPDARRKLAGTYNGSIEWSIGGEVKSGTLQTIVRLRTKNILGPFRITMDGVTQHFRLYGRIKSKSNGEAYIVFLVYSKKGNYATGNGTILNGVFTGKAQSHPVGSSSTPITISFSVTKVQT